MPRVKIEVDKADIVRVMNELESSKTYTNRTELYADIAKKLELLSPGVTGPVIYLRVKEYGIEPKTPKGKAAGFPVKNPLAGIPDRKPRREKWAGNDSIQKSLKDVRGAVPKKYSLLVDKLHGGSLIAAVALKCLDCMNFNTAEIKQCPCTDCSLYPFRPYQEDNETTNE